MKRQWKNLVKIQWMWPICWLLSLLSMQTLFAVEPVLLANTLRWTTASEVENLGYDVYRAESEDGPFERINQDTIPGAGTSDDVQDYVFVDDTIHPGVAYYYYVESIALDGERERFTPVFQAPPKP